jgi:cysteine desulfurase / selenocysteine lyase
MKTDIIYLDNGATSWPKPPEVARAMVEFLETKAGNPGRGGHMLARAAAETLAEARSLLTDMVKAESSRRIVLTHGCTDAVNLAIHGIFRGPICQCPSGRPHAVASALEHNAVLRSLHRYEAAGVIDLSIVGCGEDGVIDPDEFLAACNDKTVLACLTHASNVLGTVQDVAAVGARLRGVSERALFLVDAAQTAGHIPLDVCAWNVDLLAMAGHKGLLGPTGTGALYVGRRAFPDDSAEPHLSCERQGGTGAIAPGLEMPQVLPDALEAGTMNAVGFAGLIAAMELLPTVDHALERALTGQIIDGLLGIKGVKVYGLSMVQGRTASVAFNIDKLSSRKVASELDEFDNIAVRGGLHCAPLIHEVLGTGEDGALRASPGPWNTKAQIDEFLEAISRIAAG